MSPVTGPIATATAAVLAVALGAAQVHWQGERDRYEARITQLGQAAEQRQTALRTELAACHAADADRTLTEAQYAAAGKTLEGARRLLEQEPAGIDACARMESADRAVLSNLKQ